MLLTGVHTRALPRVVRVGRARRTRSPARAAAASAPYDCWSAPGGRGCALRAFAPDVWLAERPFVWNGIDVGGRCTVLRLSDGSLLVHSPVEPDAALRSALDSLGPVRHVVAPNREHLRYWRAFSAAFPEAVAYGPAGLTGPTVPDRYTPLGRDPPPAWLGDVLVAALDFERNPLTGGPFFDERLLCFPRARLALATDFAWTYPSQGLPAPTVAWKFAMDVIYPPVFRALLLRDRDRARAAAAQVAAWPVDALVPCHGVPLARGGKAALMAAFERMAGV